MKLRKDFLNKFKSLYILIILIILFIFLIELYLEPSYSSLSLTSIVKFILIILVIFNNFHEKSEEKVNIINIKLINVFYSENIIYYDLLYPVDMVIDYLISNTIFYYIKSESETYASNEVKNLFRYFNIIDKLLFNYFINKDYEYGTLKFYSTE